MINTAQKMKFSIKDFFSKCDQIRKKKKKCILYIHRFLTYVQMLLIQFIKRFRLMIFKTPFFSIYVCQISIETRYIDRDASL